MTPIDQRKSTSMFLYRLTIRHNGVTTDIYSMATSVESAFQRYLDRTASRKESVDGVKLVHGEPANPFPTTAP